MTDMIASPFKLQILHMIEALLDVMKWPSWILHLSDCVTTSTIAAIIVLGAQPIFHCTRSAALLLQNLEWTRGFGFLLLRMWPFPPPGTNSQSVNWPLQSLSRFMESLRGSQETSRGGRPGSWAGPRAADGKFLTLTSTLTLEKI